MTKFKTHTPTDFTHPTSVPQSEEQFQKWQNANREWWELHPMRYDWTKEVKPEEFTKEFYAEIDSRLFSAAKEYMGWQEFPFDPLIDFDSLQSKDVLEIGVGSGCHAQLLAQHARSFHGIDITDYAIRSTTERMRIFGLNTEISRMEAEQMTFEDESFDFIWSWGVIHHCSDPRRVLQEMRRVLRPGGTAVTMVYHRNFWNYYVFGGFFHGILRGDLWNHARTNLEMRGQETAVCPIRRPQAGEPSLGRLTSSKSLRSHRRSLGS